MFVRHTTTSASGCEDGQVSFSCDWASVEDERGTLMVPAWAQAGGQTYGPLSSRLDVGTTLWLPVIVSDN